MAPVTLNQLETYILLESYHVGTSVCLARVIAAVINQPSTRTCFKTDLPPKPFLTVAEVSQLTLEDFSYCKTFTDAPALYHR